MDGDSKTGVREQKVAEGGSRRLQTGGSSGSRSQCLSTEPTVGFLSPLLLKIATTLARRAGMASSSSSSSSPTSDGSCGSEGEGSSSAPPPRRGHRCPDVKDPAWQARACTKWVQHLDPRYQVRTKYRRPQRVRLLFPCAGFDAPGQALDAMGIQYTAVGVWDTNRGSAKFLRARYTNKRVVHAGPQEGDVMQVNPQSLPDADGLVAGPPCQPFSSIGSKRGWDDDRSQVFRRIIEWIRELANRETNPLRFFALENVVGLRTRVGKSTRAGHSAEDTVLRELRSAVPKTWRISTHRLTSDCTGQTRKRIYVIGHEVASRSRLADDYIQALPRKSLGEVLLHLSDRGARAKLSQKQAEHLPIMLRRSRALSKKANGNVMSWEADRSPKSDRAHICTTGLSRCLRASAPKMWVVKWKGGRTTISRLLHAAERCLLQGMSAADMPRNLSVREIEYGVGNAMTVPVVGMVMNALLLAVEPLLGTQALGRPRRLDIGTEGQSSSKTEGQSSSDSEGQSSDDTESGGSSSSGGASE